MSAKDLLLATVVTQECLQPVALPEFPALDGKVFVRVLTAGERQLWSQTALQARDAGGFISDYELVAIAACEADGTPMFHRRQADGRIRIDSADIAKLLEVNGKVTAAIARKAMEVSGLDSGASERAKKDSATDLNGDSSSDSQLSSVAASNGSSETSTLPN